MRNRPSFGALSASGDAAPCCGVSVFHPETEIRKQEVEADSVVSDFPGASEYISLYYTQRLP